MESASEETSPGGDNRVMVDTSERKFGMGRGSVFPAAHARSLLHPARRILQSPRRMVASMALPTHAHVLEIGSGPGFFSPYIADVVHQGGLMVLDLQNDMLQLARSRMSGRTNVRFVQADGLRLPFPTGCFDAVLIAIVLGEIPGHDRFLAEVRRVLRAGGIASVAETFRDSDFMSLPELKRLFEPRSFAFVGKRGTRWQYVARFEAT